MSTAVLLRFGPPPQSPEISPRRTRRTRRGPTLSNSSFVIFVPFKAQITSADLPGSDANPLTLSFIWDRDSDPPEHQVFWSHRDYNAVKQYFCKLDGEKEYRSLGPSEQLNPVTRLPFPVCELKNIEISETRPRTLYIKYVDVQDKQHGPYQFNITLADFMQGDVIGGVPDGERKMRLVEAKDEIRRGLKPGSEEIHSALELGDLEQLELYLASGANPNEKMNRSVPLTYALVGGSGHLTMADREKMVELLLKYGAQPTLETITIARENGTPRIRQLLEAARAKAESP